MDFFSAAVDPQTQAVSLSHDVPDSTDNSSFAQAIANRFGHSNTSILTTRLTPTTIHPIHSPDTPMAKMSLSPSTCFTAVPPSDLDAWLNNSGTLIVDIRPHAAYSSARIPKAISLCVPSTLLKRPLFSLQKLSAMLPSPSARNRFSTWRSAARIIVYDADSQANGESSNINGLLKKFKNDGFEGNLAWLKGGFQAVWKERRELVDTNPPTPEGEGDDDDADLPPKPSNVLRTRHLPMAAFSLSSTTISLPNQKDPQPNPPTLSTRLSTHASNPFFDAIRQNVELSHGITDRIPLTLPHRVRRRIHELPFPWLQSIARRAAHAPRRQHHNHTHAHGRSIDDTTTASSSESDNASADDGHSVEEGKEALAMQFYKIELAEQRRLMGVMQHHSRESGAVMTKQAVFPFSITAGVEKGAKNRYRHIWPFEHARVRLHQASESDDDYINASYVQPLSTNRRYIATQGPLPATFTDFWTLVWEQNVHVIVMLTREVEGAMVKCGSYWTDTEFGPLRLRLVGTEGLPPTDEEMGDDRTGAPRTAHPGFFGEEGSSSSGTAKSPPVQKMFPLSAGPNNHSHTRYLHRPHHHRSSTSTATVKRTFELVHTEYPDVKPRKVIHLQYLEWPDMNVPDDPRGVLGLVKRVEDAVRETGGGGFVSTPVPVVDLASATMPTDTQGKPGGSTSSLSTAGSSHNSSNTQIPPFSTLIDPLTGISLQALDPSIPKDHPNNEPPVLLHCSAGVGRTGGFIAVDAILDGVRREVRESFRRARGQGAQKQEGGEGGDAMDVDQPGEVGLGISRGGSAFTDESFTPQISIANPDVDNDNSMDMDIQVDKVDKHNLEQNDREVKARDRVKGGMVIKPEQSRKERKEQRHEFDQQLDKAGTTKWAENVRDGIGGEGEVQWREEGSGTMNMNMQRGTKTNTPNIRGAIHDSTVSIAGKTPNTTTTTQNQSTFSSILPTAQRTSSSIPTASASAPPPPPSSSSATSPPRTIPMPVQFPMPGSSSNPNPNDLLQHVLQQQLVAEQRRMRTVSAPPSDIGSGGPNTSASGSSGTSGQSASGRPGAAFKLKLPMPMVRGASIAGSGVSASKGGSPPKRGVGVGVVGSPSKMGMNVVGSPPQSRGVMSSEGEAPSRSQSPSDDASSLSGPLEMKVRTGLSLQHPIPVSALLQPPAPFGSSDSSSAPLALSGDTPAATAGSKLSEGSHTASDKSFDYKEPRQLHTHPTPPLLTTFDSPIWEVIQDMREQRMSLCQSLRQYVFVHAAIVEGALIVLDEEREIAEGLGPRNVLHSWYSKQHQQQAQSQQQMEGTTHTGGFGYWPESATSGMFSAMSVGGYPDSATTIPPNSSRSATSYGAGRSSPTPSSSGRSSRSRSTSRGSRRHAPYGATSGAGGAGGAGGSGSGSGSGNAKRPSSPTELLKEDKEGGLMLSKRPSIKRKQRSGEGGGVGGAHGGMTKEEAKRYHPVPVRVTSGALSTGNVSAPSEAAGREVV